MFPNSKPLDYSAWLAQIKKENPSWDVNIPAYKIDGEFQTSSFPHPDHIIDLNTNPLVSKNQKILCGTQISNFIQLQAAFDAGTEFILIQDSTLSEIELGELLNQIQLDFVKVRIDITNPINYNSLLNKLPGSYFSHENLLISAPLSLSRTLNRKPDSQIFTSIKIDTSQYNKILKSLQNVCDDLSKAEKATDYIFDIHFYDDFYISISIVRALQKIMRKISFDFGIFINCQFQAMLPFSVNEDNKISPYISNSTMSLAAFLSSCDYVCVYDSSQLNMPLRNALLIQQLCKYESYLDKVIDPLAGSYFIEQMTEQFALSWWKKLSY